MKLEAVVESNLAKASVNGTGNRVPAIAEVDTTVERTGEALGNDRNRGLAP